MSAGLRRDSGLPSVAVAQAWLDRDDAGSVIERLAGFDFVRSVRHKPRANATPAERRSGGMTDPRWRRGFAMLARRLARFDLQTPWWHLGEAADLARDFPDMLILHNHTGLPFDRHPDAIAAWSEEMAMLAGYPNVAVKISGLGVRGKPWTVEANREIVLTTIDLFGIDRCMFASNFPVELALRDLRRNLWRFDAITCDFSESDRRALFADNARRLYDIR